MSRWDFFFAHCFWAVKSLIVATDHVHVIFVVGEGCRIRAAESLRELADTLERIE